MLELTMSPESAEKVKYDPRPPSPFDVVTAQAAHQDDWARFPAAWPHLVVMAENGQSLVYGVRMRHLDGMLTQIGRPCSNLYEAKLRLELFYIELTLAARMRGGFYAEDHVRQCRGRLSALMDDAASRRVQDPDTSPLRQFETIPFEFANGFSYPLYHPFIAKDRSNAIFWKIAHRDESGEVSFDHYSILGREDTALSATAAAIGRLYKWVNYRHQIIGKADEIQFVACERRGYDRIDLETGVPLADDDDKPSYFYKP